jgi:hypothetical protein
VSSSVPCALHGAHAPYEGHKKSQKREREKERETYIDILYIQSGFDGIFQLLRVVRQSSVEEPIDGSNLRK